MTKPTGKPLKIDIPEDAALRAFLKTPPPRKANPIRDAAQQALVKRGAKPKKKAAKKRK